MGNWFRRTSAVSSKSSRTHSRPTYRPTLEGLEERCLLAGYIQVNLISDLPGVARTTDANLVNPWGIAFQGNGPFWVADNNSGFATAYDGTGAPFPAGNPIIVTIPPPHATPTATAAPTGIVANTTTDFVVNSGNNSGPAAFIFVTEDGTLSAWNQTVNANAAILEVDNTNTTTGSVYKGLALGSNSSGNFLFATNFRLGTIDVFDKTFTKVTNLPGHFTDSNLPAGFAPFGIQNLGGQLFVSYAKQDPAKQNHDDLGGAGNGFIDVFDTSGNFVKRLVSQGNLNSPWGMVIAPSGFGELSGDLLVGNFKDGHINAYNPTSGTFVGQLNDASGNPVVIDRPWSLTFGNGGSAGDPHTLFFSAGIQNETHGLFGSLQVNPNAPPPAPGSLNPFLSGLYHQLLHREVDAASQTVWLGLMNQGVSRALVALTIENCMEHRIVQVEQLYQALLGRPADPVGLQLATQFLNSGGPLDVLKAVILGSPEYFQEHGGTNAGFQTGLYHDVLGRPIDTVGQQGLGAFLAGGGSRTEAAFAVLRSAESDVVQTAQIFQTVLGRTGDLTSIALLANILHQHPGQDDLFLAMFLASDEFAAGKPSSP